MLQEYPSYYGLKVGYTFQEPEDDVPAGKLGFDAPNNIGLMMIGWVYGEGDFSKSICIAAGCCEDADCTAGTLGSILGIIGGTKVIDEKWLVPIGDEIKYICVCTTKQNWIDGAVFPTSVTDFTERLVQLMPTFMHNFLTFGEKGEMELYMSENLYDQPIRRGPFQRFGD